MLWNPHLQMEACYKDFVCVENAKVQNFQAFSVVSTTLDTNLGLSL